MIVVGMISAYKEGTLIRSAVRSLCTVGLDALYLFEGPAGEPLPDDVPNTDIRGCGPIEAEQFVLHQGRWRTDGRKRNEMLQRAKHDHDGQPFWCVVLDADELLIGGEWLRDRLQQLLWDDEWKGATTADPGNPPMARWPLHLIEQDGSMSHITGRVFRGDLVRSIDISSSVVTNVSGVRDGWGNHQASSRLWLEAWMAATDRGQLVAWPPFPGETCIVHRPHLRHPGRRGLRMSDQETSEFARAREQER